MLLTAWYARRGKTFSISTARISHHDVTLKLMLNAHLLEIDVDRDVLEVSARGKCRALPPGVRAIDGIRDGMTQLGIARVAQFAV
jgi:hypothetical protein